MVIFSWKTIPLTTLHKESETESGLFWKQHHNIGNGGGGGGGGGGGVGEYQMVEALSLTPHNSESIGGKFTSVLNSKSNLYGEL